MEELISEAKCVATKHGRSTSHTLMASKDMFKDFFINSGIGILTLKKDGTIIDSNPATADMLGLSQEEIWNKNVSDYVDFSQREQLKLVGKLRFERKLKHKDGHQLWLSITADKVRSGFSDSFYYIILIEDISERKHAEIKLQEKIEELNSIIYKASHDLKAPLASNAGLVNLALMEIKDVDARVYLKKIQTSNDRLNTILNDLFRVSKVDNSKGAHCKVNMREIIENILEDIKNLPDFDKIDVQLDLLDTEKFVGDPYIIRSIFQNVIANAVAYQDSKKKQGKLLIEMTNKENQIVTCIKDNGLGIDPKELSKIFGMFHRANARTEGTGLGLYISKSSLEKIGGKIEVDSIEGVGSTFVITIPK